MKATPAALRRLELLFKSAGYVVRREKGNFTGGYCVLEHKRVVVLNKFFPLESQFDILADLTAQLALDSPDWDDADRDFVRKLRENRTPAP